MYVLQNLKPVHKAVARDMALGLDLRTICESRGLNYNSWNQICGSSLFQEEISRVQQDIEESIVDDVVNDPVRRRLQAEALRSVERLVKERDNEDPDSSTASARIKAADSLLDRTSYSRRMKEEEHNVVVINLSSDKLDKLNTMKSVESQPTVFTADCL